MDTDDEAVVSAALVTPQKKTKQEEKQVAEVEEEATSPVSRPPTFRECPLCKREFGSRSLEIHLSSCAEKLGVDLDEAKNKLDGKKDKSPSKVGFHCKILFL
jgi:hypothetical protein